MNASWTALAAPEQASRLRREAVAFAQANDVPDPPLADLRLALAEAINNVVIHAYAPGAPGEVTVEMAISVPDRELSVRVRDEGGGMTPRSDSPGLGLGMPLITQVTTSAEFRTQAGGIGSEVAMTFALA